jgi:hypothetical protein
MKMFRYFQKGRRGGLKDSMGISCTGTIPYACKMGREDRFDSLEKLRADFERLRTDYETLKRESRIERKEGRVLPGIGPYATIYHIDVTLLRDKINLLARHMGVHFKMVESTPEHLELVPNPKEVKKK